MRTLLVEAIWKGHKKKPGFYVRASEDLFSEGLNLPFWLPWRRAYARWDRGCVCEGGGS